MRMHACTCAAARAPRAHAQPRVMCLYIKLYIRSQRSRSAGYPSKSGYGMFIKYMTSRLGCLRLPVEANSPLNSMGIYTVFDRAPLPRIGDLPNGLHIDLKFQNQAIQCCLFEPRGMKYDRAVRRERATSI